MAPTAPKQRGGRANVKSSASASESSGSGWRAPEGDSLPALLLVPLVVMLSACLSFAVVAIPLALVDQFAEAPVLICAGLLTIVIATGWLRTIAPFEPAHFGIATTLGVGTIAVITALNVRYASQNVVQDRDPGAYNVSARWFASHHTFFFDGLVGAFSKHAQLTVAGAGFRAGAPGGRVYPQFLHVLPAFLSAADWIGGNALLFKGNALIGAVALLAFYAFVRLWLREGLAVAAVVLLALNIVQIIHTRNTYSEILSQAFLFGGLWALVEADRAATVRARPEFGYLVAGLLLGATGMVRIDGFVYLIPIAIVATARLWHAEQLEPAEAHRARVAVAVFSAGIAFTSALGLIDGLRFSRPYFDDNKALLLEVFAALVLTIGGCAIALYVHRRRDRPLITPRMIHILGIVAAVAIVLVVVWAWFIRPHSGNVYENLRPSGGISDLRTKKLPHKIPLRTYAERTVPRIALFVGATTLAAGFIGFAMLIRRLLKNPSDPRLAFVLIFGVTTTLYVYRPSIASDMIWFLRRFLPVTIPGLILFMLVIVEELFRRRGTLALVVAGALLVGGLGWTAALLPPHIFKRTYNTLLAGVDDACAGLGPSPAVVIVQSQAAFTSDGPQYRYPQAMQAFCNVPVATAPPGLSESFYRSLAVEWKAQGRALQLVSSNPAALFVSGHHTRLLQDSEYLVLEHTLHTVPKHYIPVHLVLYAAPVATG